MATMTACPTCGKEFERIGAKKFCSVKCRKKYNSQKPKSEEYKSPKLFECGWCGLFFQSRKKEEYCCDECRKKGENRKRKRAKKKFGLNSIDAIAIAARKEGLSYGQYVAKYGL